MDDCNKVCAVVVTYNRKEKLRKCIECLLNQKGTECDILLVNNASTDGTQEMVLSEYDLPQIHYYNTGSNLGGAGGFEFGVREAVLKGYEYVWIMDDDTWPDETALSEFFAADAELGGDWGFLSGLAYWTDGSICSMNIQKKNIFRHIGTKEYAKNISPVKMCSFVSLLVKSSVVKDVGLPIGEYFIWTDDYEFTGRISRRFKCYMVTRSKATHAMDKHMRVNFAKDSSGRIERYTYIYRNDVHCYRQYGIGGWLYIVLKDLYSIVNILINSDGDRLKKTGVLLSGFRAGLSFHPKIDYVRC